MDPIPVPEDIAKAYQSYYTHRDTTDEMPEDSIVRRFARRLRTSYLARVYGYATGGSKSHLGLLVYLVPLRRSAFDFSVMYLSFLPGGRLLEIGCGNGVMLEGMADLGWEVEGVDFDPAAVDTCRRRGLNTKLGTLEDQQYPSNSYDAVTMSHLIEHVHEPLNLLIECHRILKPGGQLSLVTPNVASAGHQFYGPSWFHLDPPRHLRIFSVAALEMLLRKAGFRNIKIRTTIRDAVGAHVGSRSIRRIGQLQFGSRQPWSARSWGQALTAIEWAWLKANKEVGEEIAVVAQKSE
jgi:2-polyprenyl-3-methyl-5-hydroxy-6-metoxy-1,4-benzoquinol methylase